MPDVDFKTIAERSPHEVHEAFADWITELGATKVDASQVAAVLRLYPHFRQDAAYETAIEAHRANVAAEAQAAKNRAAQRTQERLDRLTKQAEELRAKLEGTSAAPAKKAAPARKAPAKAARRRPATSDAEASPARKAPAVKKATARKAPARKAAKVVPMRRPRGRSAGGPAGDDVYPQQSDEF